MSGAQAGRSPQATSLDYLKLEPVGIFIMMNLAIVASS